MAPTKNVFITGLGTISSQGKGLDCALASLSPYKGKCPTIEYRDSSLAPTALPVPTHATEIAEPPDSDRSQWYTMLATREAMRTAGLLDNIGAEISNSFSDGSMLLAELGTNSCFRNRSAPGPNHPLKTALETISSGDADTILLGGTDVMSPSQNPHARGQFRGNIPPGEGAAFMILECRTALKRRNNKPICRIIAMRETELSISGVEEENNIAESLLDDIDDLLADAGLWEGDLGAIFVTCTLADCHSRSTRIVSQTLKDFQCLPIYPLSPAIGHLNAAAMPLQCSLAAMVVANQHTHRPPQLQNVKDGTELWVEYQPEKLLGINVMVIDTSSESFAIALLGPT